MKGLRPAAVFLESGLDYLENIGTHQRFMESGKERLTRDTVRDATRREIDELKRENTELKQLVADLSLDVYRLKKTAVPPLANGDGA